MPRMTVKPSRPLGVLRWHAHCPVCPYVSLPLTCSGHAGDDARRHAESHRCWACGGHPWRGILIMPDGTTHHSWCKSCDRRGWV